MGTHTLNTAAYTSSTALLNDGDSITHTALNVPMQAAADNTGYLRNELITKIALRKFRRCSVVEGRPDSEVTYLDNASYDPSTGIWCAVHGNSANSRIFATKNLDIWDAGDTAGSKEDLQYPENNGAGRWMVANWNGASSQTDIYTTTDPYSSSWTEYLDVGGGSSDKFTYIRYGSYGGGTWVALGTGSTWRSTDNGATWASVAGSGTHIIYVSAASRFVVISGNVIKTSDDGGASWTTRNNTGSNQSMLHIAPNGDLLAFGTTDNKQFRSTNNGTNWTEESPTVDWTGATTSAVNLTSLGIIVVEGSGAPGGKISHDNGVTWTALGFDIFGPICSDGKRVLFSGGDYTLTVG